MVAVGTAEFAVAGLWKNPFGVVPVEDASAVANTTLLAKEKFRRRLRPAKGVIPP